MELTETIIPDIEFVWDEATYFVSYDSAGKSQYIVLPNETILRVVEWQESVPTLEQTEEIQPDSIVTWAKS